MFSREDLLLYFSDRYSQDKVLQGLNELAKVDPEIDPESLEFDGSIVDRMEQIFQVIGDAITASFQLSGTSDLAQIEQTAINLANSREIIVPADTLKGLIEILDAEAAVEAVSLFQRRKTIREGVLNQLEINALADANLEAAKRMDALNRLCNDPEVLDQILQDYGLLTNSESERQHLELTTSCSLNFDVEQFLSVVNSEKKSQPRTVGDTQRLAKSLITRALR